MAGLMRALLMTAKLMSRSVCFEPISKSALYQGTTSVVPKWASRTRALAPAALFPSQFGFGSVRQLNLRGGPLQHSIAPEVCLSNRLWRTLPRKETPSRYMSRKAYEEANLDKSDVLPACSSRVRKGAA